VPTPHGRSPECYFTSYDPQREVFCLIMEDMNTAGYTGGDQLSGGPGEGEPPHLAMFLKTQATIGLYPIVTFQYSSTTLSQFSYHIQSLFFESNNRISP
jgi:hypothetical protein